MPPTHPDPPRRDLFPKGYKRIDLVPCGVHDSMSCVRERGHTKALTRNDVKWVTLDFPAIRLGRSRAAQRAELVKIGKRPAPRFSMCVKCPFKGPDRWRQTSTSDLPAAYEYDEFVRDGLEPAGVEETCFVSNRLIPLERLIRNGDPQPSLPGFDIPGCDEGQCFL